MGITAVHPVGNHPACNLISLFETISKNLEFAVVLKDSSYGIEITFMSRGDPFARGRYRLVPDRLTRSMVVDCELPIIEDAVKLSSKVGLWTGAMLCTYAAYALMELQSTGVDKTSLTRLELAVGYDDRPVIKQVIEEILGLPTQRYRIDADASGPDCRTCSVSPDDMLYTAKIFPLDDISVAGMEFLSDRPLALAL